MEVIWLDAYINADHEASFAEGSDKFGSLIECRDIGYLVRKNRKEVVLSVSRCFADNTTRISNTIPRNWVKAIIYLKPEELHEEKPQEAEAGPHL